MAWSSALSIIIPPIAVLAAPFLSNWYVETKQTKTETQRMKDHCFFTLYSYRELPTDENFVRSLNAIPLLFSKHQEIMDVMRELIEWLNNHGECEANVKNWSIKAGQLRYKLLSKISKKTSYGKQQINDLKGYAYVPKSVSENYELSLMIPTSLKRIADAVETQTEALNAALLNKNNEPKKETETCE